MTKSKANKTKRRGDVGSGDWLGVMGNLQNLVQWLRDKPQALVIHNYRASGFWMSGHNAIKLLAIYMLIMSPEIIQASPAICGKMSADTPDNRPNIQNTLGMNGWNLALASLKPFKILVNDDLQIRCNQIKLSSSGSGITAEQQPMAEISASENHANLGNLYETMKPLIYLLAAVAGWLCCGWYEIRKHKTKTRMTPNDPSSATRRTGRNDCNRDAPAGFAAAHG